MLFYYLHPPRRLCNRWRLSVRLLVCMFVKSVIQKLIDRFSSKFSHIVYIRLSKSWLNVGDANVTLAYFKSTLKFMGPLPRQSSTSAVLLFHIIPKAVPKPFIVSSFFCSCMDIYSLYTVLCSSKVMNLLRMVWWFFPFYVGFQCL